MSEEKLRIIRHSADAYKKLPKDKQMFVLGFMQGVLSEQQGKTKKRESKRALKEWKGGEVYFTDLVPVIGNEQDGKRPCVVIQNDVGNKYFPTTIVTSMIERDEKMDGQIKDQKGRQEREQTTIRLPTELKEELQREADRRGDSLNGFIIMLLGKAWELIQQDRWWFHHFLFHIL